MQVDGYRQSLHNFKTIKWNDKVVVSRCAAYTTLSLPRLCRTSHAGLQGLSDHARLFANPVSCSYNSYQSCLSNRIDNIRISDIHMSLKTTTRKWSHPKSISCRILFIYLYQNTLIPRSIKSSSILQTTLLHISFIQSIIRNTKIYTIVSTRNKKYNFCFSTLCYAQYH